MEERFLSLVETGALVKRPGTWSLGEVPSSVVPQALERLVRARVDRLPSPSRETVIAASVLGAEFSFTALEVVTEVGADLTAVVEELCHARLLTEVRRQPERVLRFRHALIQEAIYGGLLRDQRRRLHERAAWGLEAASVGRLKETAAIIGHHFALAGEPERALHHLTVAGEYAAANFAIDEAVSSYRRALQMAEQTTARPGASSTAVELRAELAEVLWRSLRFQEAREALEEAIALIGPGRAVQAGRLQARLGRVEVEDHRYAAAEIAFDAAEAALGDFSLDKGQDWFDVWLEVQVDGRANMYNWANEPERAALVLEKARPFIEAHGSRLRKGGFYVQLAFQRARKTRYRIDEETLVAIRAASQLAEGVSEYDRVAVLGSLGELLFWHGDTDQSESTFEAAIAICERFYDEGLRIWCLVGLCLIGVRRHDLEAVRSRSLQASEAAANGRPSVFKAAAEAAKAWVAWKDGQDGAVVRHATKALAMWRDIAPVYFFKGLCLWPLMAVRLASGAVEMAVDAASQMLEPSQVLLPDRIESLVESAKAAEARHERDSAAAALTEALRLACELGFA